MTKRKRTLIGVVAIELLIAGAWYYLHMKAVTEPGWTPDATRRIGEVFGGAMGLILGLTPVLYLIARRNDLKDAQGRRF